MAALCGLRRRHAGGHRQANPHDTARRQGRDCLTGKRDAISTPVNEAMYVSGLAHVLSISGYHKAVVAGIIFFVLRALFALMLAFSSRHPIKKWAALAAFGAAAFYLVLWGRRSRPSARSS